MSSQSLGKQLLALIEMAITEQRRLEKMLIEETELSKRASTFAPIKGSNSGNFYLVGQQFISRSAEFACRYLQQKEQTHLISTTEAARFLQGVIADRFLGNKVEPSIGEASKLIQELAFHIGENKAEYVFYWPCHITHEASPTRFELGGIIFYSSPNFEEVLEAILHQYRDQSNNRKIKTTLENKLRSYFEGFQWFAEVRLSASDASAGRRRSLEAVHIALSALKLMIGGATESRIRVSEYPGVETEKATLHQRDGKASITITRRGNTAYFTPDWWSDLNSADNSVILKTLNSVVLSAYRPEFETYLKRKILNGLIWFGEAALDPIAASRLGKFINAVESVVLCGEREKLTETIGSRVASLTGPRGAEPFDERKLAFKKLYNVRSEIFHGTRSPMDLELGSVAYDAGEAARSVLAGYLNFVGIAAIDRDDINHDMLADNFAIIEHNIRAMEKPSSDEIPS